MSDLKRRIEQEVRNFEISPDLFDRTKRLSARRERRRKIRVTAVALLVAASGTSVAWFALRPLHPIPLASGGSKTPSTAASGPLIGKIVLAGATTDVANHGAGVVPQIMEMDPGSTTGKIVAPSPYPQWDPAVSPDGTKIAYRGYFGPEEGDYDLYLVNADGTGITRLTKDALADSPSWSPDGSQLAFASSGSGGVPGSVVGRALIEVINADGSGLHPLTDPPDAAEDSAPAWSPDGTRVAFVRLTPAEGFQIYTIRADGTDLTKLTSIPGEKSNPSWSPEGNMIAFRDTRQGEPSQIYVVAADGGAPTQLTRTPGNSTNPVWIDEARIAFVYQEPEGTLLQGPTNQIRTISPEGSDVTVISSSDQSPLSGEGGQFVPTFDWRVAGG